MSEGTFSDGVVHLTPALSWQNQKASKDDISIFFLRNVYINILYKFSP